MHLSLVQQHFSTKFPLAHVIIVANNTGPSVFFLFLTPKLCFTFRRFLDNNRISSYVSAANNGLLITNWCCVSSRAEMEDATQVKAPDTEKSDLIPLI